MTSLPSRRTMARVQLAAGMALALVGIGLVAAGAYCFAVPFSMSAGFLIATAD
jgi:hypothetical protein